MQNENVPSEAKDFRLVAVPFGDANYSFAIFHAKDRENLLKIGPSSTTCVRDEVEANLDKCFELGRDLTSKAPRFFPEVNKHIEGIIFRDFSPLCHIAAERTPVARPETRRRLRRLTSCIVEQKEALNKISETFDSRIGGNRRRRLEEEEQSVHEELRQLERLDTALVLILSLCDIVEVIHDSQELHLEISLAQVGLNRANEMLLLPSLPYGSDQTLRRRSYTEDLRGFDIVAPELHRGETPSQATDVFLIAKTFCQYLVSLNAASAKPVPQIHEMQLVKNCIPESVAGLVPVLEAALDADPSKRPPTPVELAREIGRVVARQAEESAVTRSESQEGISFRAKSSPLKNKILICLGFALLLAIALVVFSESKKVESPSLAENDDQSTELEKEEPKAEGEATEDQGSSVQYLGEPPSGSLWGEPKQKPRKSTKSGASKVVAEPKKTEPAATPTSPRTAPAIVKKPEAAAVVASKPPLTKPKLDFATPMAGEPYRKDIEVLLLRGLSSKPQRGADIYRVSLPPFTYVGGADRADDLQKSLVWTEYVQRIENAARLATSAVKKPKEELIQQYISTRAMYEHDPRLEVLIGLGLERSGYFELASQAYEAASKKWLALQEAAQQHGQSMAEASLPAQLYTRDLMRQSKWSLALMHLERISKTGNSLGVDARKDTLRFIAFALAYTEKFGGQEVGPTRVRLVAIKTMRGLESGNDAHYFTRRLLEYRDYFGSLKRSDGSHVLNKIGIHQAVETVVASVRSTSWKQSESLLLSRKSKE